MTAIALLAFAFAQADALVEKLGSADPSERARAHAGLIKLGRSVYPQLQKALLSEDAEWRMRAREIAYALGMDPETHRPWNEVWADYRHAPDSSKRQVLVRLSQTVQDPRLTLLAKIERGLFKERPSC